jgi:hypothetical protein
MENSERVIAWRKKNSDRQKLHSRLWREKNPEKAKASKRRREKRRDKRIRLKTLLLIGRGRLACEHCHCDDIKLLQINHIHGGGYKEFKETGRSKFYLDIASGRRSVDDLNLLCVLCQWKDHYERKYGPLPWFITYGQVINSVTIERKEEEWVNGGLAFGNGPTVLEMIEEQQLSEEQDHVLPTNAVDEERGLNS